MGKQDSIVKALLVTSLVLSGAWGLNVTANAATIPTTVTSGVIPDADTTTLDEALPDSDANAKIVKVAIISSDSSFKGSSTLKQVADANSVVKIQGNLTDYSPLLKVANYFNGLVVNNQTNLNQQDMVKITTAMLTNRSSTGELQALGFSNDNVNTAGLSTVLDTISNLDSAPKIQCLILNRNPLTDFTPWTDFKNSNNKQKIETINASLLKNKNGSSPVTEGKTTAAQTLKGTTLKVPYSLFSEYTTNLDGIYVGIRSYQGDSDSNDNEGSFENAITSGPFRGETEPAITAPVDSFIDIEDENTPQTVDVSNINVIDATNNVIINGSPVYLRQFGSTGYQDFIDYLNNDAKGYTYILPGGGESTERPDNVTDTTTLNIVNVPVGAKQVKIRVVMGHGDSADPIIGSSYTQIYTIPIKQKAVTPTTSTADSSSNSSNSESSTADTGQPKAKKQSVIYATKKIGLYNTPNFSAKTRQAWYPKQPRIYRPMFKVTGYAKSTNGAPRYLVKDVNRESKTFGRTGYVTTRSAYVSPAYYQQKSSKVTVIAPHGINAYQKQNLTQKVKHYRQGQVLTVKKIVRHNLTTRYILKDGRYITANKKNVQSRRVAMATKVRTKTTVNLYRDVNLKHHLKSYRKNTMIAIKGWDYSMNGAKRYQVASGYITANTKLVKVIK